MSSDDKEDSPPPSMQAAFLLAEWEAEEAAELMKKHIEASKEFLEDEVTHAQGYEFHMDENGQPILHKAPSPPKP